MALVNVKELLHKARRGGYAVGAFNVYDYVSMRAVVETAAEEASPAILQILPPVVSQFGTAAISQWAAFLARRHSTVPFVLHLDHGTDLAMIEDALRDGFTSVMFDGSAKPFEDNIRISKLVVEKAHRSGATVEGEVGCILTVNDSKAERESADRLASVAGCCRFIQETGVDVVAPAIGTAHGVYKDTPHLDCERLTAIATACNTPIAIHGGTGLTDDDFRSLIRCGASKINIATQLRLEYLAAMASFPAAHPGSDEPLLFFGDAAARIRAAVNGFIDIFGCGGKA